MCYRKVVLTNKTLRTTYLLCLINGVAFYFSGATVAAGFYFIFGNNGDLNELQTIMGKILLYAVAMSVLVTLLLTRRKRPQFTSTKDYSLFVITSLIITLAFPFVMISLS